VIKRIIFKIPEGKIPENLLDIFLGLDLKLTGSGMETEEESLQKRLHKEQGQQDTVKT
jgi:hypothetical protein